MLTVLLRQFASGFNASPNGCGDWTNHKVSGATLLGYTAGSEEVIYIQSVERTMEFCSSTDLDKWIEKLSDCKPLTETEIKLLCEQVGGA
jgi:hypothetical protein